MSAIKNKTKSEDASSNAKPELDVQQKLQNYYSLIEKCSATSDTHYILKVFRELSKLRRELTCDSLIKIITSKYPKEHPNTVNLLSTLKKLAPTEISIDDMDTTEDLGIDSNDAATELSPEVDVFTHLLVQIYLHDKNELKILNEFNDYIVRVLKTYNKRTLDRIVAKIWFYILRTKELLNDLIPIRAELLAALRTSTLRHDIETRASTITLLLRNYLLSNDISQAYNLVEKIEFPVEEASNSVVARYYYYLAKIQTIQLDYSAALECIIAAMRKAPQTKSTIGFTQTATKLNILIQLLTGEIPELSIFKDPALEDSLIPYLAVTRAVRLGDLNLFAEALDKYGKKLKEDDNYNLVLRLRQNVIKAGIRIISLSYKRISLKDICIKLHLDGELSAEYIVAKAIKDNVIDATINHQLGYMQSNEVLDIYSTNAPQAEFNRRINFCMSLHNDSVKAMRYPMSTNRIDLKEDLEQREREQELLQYLQDADDYL